MIRLSEWMWKTVVVYIVCILRTTMGLTHQVCSHQSLHLTCTAGTVLVLEDANYGRLAETACGETRPLLRPCRLASTLAKLQVKCFGREECEVGALSDLFTDPCPGVSKYLDVVYECVKGSFIFDVCQLGLLA